MFFGVWYANYVVRMVMGIMFVVRMVFFDILGLERVVVWNGSCENLCDQFRKCL